jgi:hypothetical protein
MTLDTMTIKEELRGLIDAYAYLGDEKKIAEQMDLFTSDAQYTVYMGGTIVSNTSGTVNLEKEFNGHASQVKTYFTLNGQHIVTVDDDTATGVSFSQIKMIRVVEGRDILTDYSVKYEDNYVRQQDKWLINQRTGHFVIVEARPLLN